MGDSSLRGKYQVRKPLKFRTSKKIKILSVTRHGRTHLPNAAQLGNEEPNFPPVALLLCLQCGSRLPCPTLADEWRSLADVDDCWRVGLLQQKDDCTIRIRGVLGAPGTFERRRVPITTVANPQEVILSRRIQPTQPSRARSAAFFGRLQHARATCAVL